MEDENIRLSQRRYAIIPAVKRKTLYHCSSCYFAVYEEKSSCKCPYCNHAFCVNCREYNRCPYCSKNWNNIPLKKKWLDCLKCLSKNT